MKRIIFSIIILINILFSCSKDENDDVSEKLLGHWCFSEMTIDVKENNSYIKQAIESSVQGSFDYLKYFEFKFQKDSIYEQYNVFAKKWSSGIYHSKKNILTIGRYSYQTGVKELYYRDYKFDLRDNTLIIKIDLTEDYSFNSAEYVYLTTKFKRK